MAVPNQTITPIRRLDTLQWGEECIGFCFNGLGRQPARAVPQNRRQRVVDRIGLTEENDAAT